MSCKTENIVYMIECLKCFERYIGESKRSLKDRLADHRGYVDNEKTNIVTGAHFNKPGHNLSHLSITIIEKRKYRQKDLYRKERERYFINMFNTHYKGMNTQNWSTNEGGGEDFKCIDFLLILVNKSLYKKSFSHNN